MTRGRPATTEAEHLERHRIVAKLVFLGYIAKNEARAMTL
jgi:hypothetical protein